MMSMESIVAAPLEATEPAAGRRGRGHRRAPRRGDASRKSPPKRPRPWPKDGDAVVRRLTVPLLSAFLLITAPPAAAEPRIPLDGASVEACFTPGSDCAAAIVSAIGEGTRRVWVLAYGFTLQPIADALVRARGRGADVRVVLDASNEREPSTALRTLLAAGIQVRIDRSTAIQPLNCSTPVTTPPTTSRATRRISSSTIRAAATCHQETCEESRPHHTQSNAFPSHV